MNFSMLCPFVRYAAESTYLPNRYMVKANDCRAFYVIHGSGIFYSEETNIPLKPGMLILYPAGLAYMPLSNEETPMRFYSLNFDYNDGQSHREHVMPPCPAAEFDPALAINSHTDTGIDALCHLLVLENMQYLEHEFREIVSCHARKELFWQDTTSAILKKILVAALQKNAVGSGGQQGAASVLDYIQAHYGEHLTYSDIGRALNYHPYHLNRLVRQYTGKSLHEYLLSFRLEKAMELLLNSQLSVGEIASCCGFVSAEHFSTAFRKKYGSAPRVFRRQ